jgi:hypothetical protein
MASVDLIFSSTPATGMPVSLVFGETDATVIPDVTLQGAGRITGLRLRILAHTGVVVQGGGRITGLHMRVAAVYDVNVARPTVSQAQARYQQAAQVQAGVQGHYQQSMPTNSGAAAHWQDARAVAGSVRALWQDCERIDAWARGRWQDAAGLQTLPLRSEYQEAQRLRSGGVSRWQDSIRLPTLPLAARYQETLHLRSGGAVRWQEAAPLRASIASRPGVAVAVYLGLRGRYQEAWPPRPGLSVILPPVPPKPEPCYTPSAHLLFKAPWSASTNLVFVCERTTPTPQPGLVVVPVRRVYMTVNNITLARVDTGAELRAHGFSMSLDYQSWTWSWNASLHHDAAAHLGRDSQGDPAELAVFVNGLEFRLRLESKSRDRRFSPTRWAVSGKGKASVLGSDDAPKQSFRNLVDRTAQQLMADVLTVNGVPMGWTVDWGLDDWLVPAGAWAIQGNYIDAINDIAGAAGGYVQPHNTAATLRVLPRYPLAPWYWDSIAPDFEIPADAAEVEGTEFIDKPAYNRVFMGGIGVGVFGPFTRAGTAGNIIAPQVNHALITHPDAHRQRGIAELSDTGKQERITLNMQVLQETGVIVPGQFVRYLGESTVMGIVRSTAIDWNRPRLRQTLEIETHA